MREPNVFACTRGLHEARDELEGRHPPGAGLIDRCTVHHRVGKFSQVLGAGPVVGLADVPVLSAVVTVDI